MSVMSSQIISSLTCLFDNLFMPTIKNVKSLHYEPVVIGMHWWIPEEKASNAESVPDSKVRGANMAPAWVLSAPGGPHNGP